MPSNDTTTKLKMDISDLKRSMTEARRQIRLANSEFKASQAGMDNWAQSADGLSAKMNQLRATLKAEKSILADLQKQYDLVVQSESKSSKGAQELMIKINNQQASINKTKASLEKYGRALSDLEKNSVKTAVQEDISAFDRLSNAISEQESELEGLKNKYASLVIEYGKNSTQAKETANAIDKLSSDIRQSKSEMGQAKAEADKLDHSLDQVGDSAKEAGDGFTVMKGVLADLIADGIKGGVSTFKEFATESSTAYQKFQAQTGATAEEIGKFKSEMNELYSNAYGESLQDIGDKMAYVKQVTGETDPSKIKELVENAITLEDTFGSDFNETVRGVNNLMQHFGIDSQTAFDLFAKGSQLGLDYTGELGDNIAEYGGNFKQAGYSAEEYFQLLVNGSHNGAYNLDKVNDSINEVKNRLGDGTIEKSIGKFSDNTQKAFKNWKSGKGTMKDVIDSIVKDIKNCTNEQEALTLAQIAFGTMGEDANLKVVKSLTATGDEFENVKGTMEDMKNVRYSDVATEFTTLGRTLQQELLVPLAQKVLPTFQKLGDFAINNLNSIIPVAKAVGVAVGAMFTINKVATFVTSLKTLGVALGVVKVATDAQTASTLALNSAWLLSPVGLVTAGVTALVGGLIAYGVATSNSTKKTDENTKATDALISKQKQLTSALKESKQARKEETTSAKESGATADFYMTKLSELIGVENKSASQKMRLKTYVEKLNEIMPELNLKYDEEADKLNMSTDAIRQNISAQKELLLAKSAQANMESIAEDIAKLEVQQAEATKQNEKNEKAYAQAKKETTKAYEEYRKTGTSVRSQEYQNYLQAKENEDKKKQAYEKTKQAVKDNEAELKRLNAEYDKTADYANEKLDSAELEKSIASITQKMKAKGLEIPKAISEGMKSGQYVVPETVAGMKNLIKFDELAQKAKLDGVKIPTELGKGISSGKISAEEAVKQLQRVAKFDNSSIVADAKEAGIKIPNSLRDGIASGKVSVEEATKRIEQAVKFANMASNSGKEGKKTAQKLVQGILSGEISAKEAGKKLGEATTKGEKAGAKGSKKAGEKAGSDYSSGVGSKSGSAKTSGQKGGKSAVEGQKSGSKGAKKAGETTGQNYASGVGSKQGTAKSKGSTVGKGAVSGAKSGAKGAKKTGQKTGSDYASGVGSKAGTAKSKGKSLGASAKSGAGSVSARSSGENFSKGFINGIGSFLKSAWNAGLKLAKNALSGLKAGQKEGSPSKLTRQSGLFFGEGYRNGISEMTKSVVKQAYDMATKAYKSLQEAQKEGSPSKLTYQSGKYFAQGFANGIASQTKYVISAVKTYLSIAFKELNKLHDNNFSEVGGTAISSFSQSLSEKISSAYESVQNLQKTKYDEYTKAINKLEDERDKKVRALTKKKNSAKTKQQKNAIQKQIDSVKNTYAKKIQSIKDYRTSYNTASKKALSAFKESLEDFEDKANQVVEDTINGITEKYQEKYNDLSNAQSSLAEKLKSHGDLFTVSSAGIMTVNDINQQIEEIKQYTEKLAKAKNLLGENLFNQIANMDMEQGEAYMDRLFAMSDAELKAYSDAYDEKVKLSDELAESMYKSDIDKLANDYKKEITSAMGPLKKELEQLGTDMMKGFINGLNGSKKNLSKDIQKICNTIIEQFKKELKIHSPSKIMKDLGSYVSEGLGDGIQSGIKYVKDAMSDMIDAVSVPVGDVVGSVDTAKLKMQKTGIKKSAGNGNTTIVNNYELVQNNTSPKSLSALDTYRARKQQIAMVKAFARG